MPEVANCPVCGKEPKKTVPWTSGETYNQFSCCGIIANGEENWNRYAAAMELARAVLRLHNDDTKTAHQWEFFVEEAEKRVLEVWK